MSILLSIRNIDKNSSIKGAGILLALLLLIIANPAGDARPSKAADAVQDLLAQLPPTVSELGNIKPDFAKEISRSFAEIKEICPATRDIDIKHPWNLSNWLNNNISPSEWAAAPYAFRTAALRATSVQRNTQVKVELLSKLEESIPHHPAFLLWVDHGKEELHNAFVKDQYIAHEKSDWNNVIKDRPRFENYIKHIIALSFHSYLPHTTFNMPSIELTAIPQSWDGLYVGTENKMYLNLSLSTSLHNPDKALEVVTHETFHAIQTVIKNWYVNPAIQLDTSMKDSGEKYFYTSTGKLAYIPHSIDESAYRNTFNERLAFYAATATLPTPPYQTKDPEWLKSHPLTNNAFDNPTRGTIPKACIE